MECNQIDPIIFRAAERFQITNLQCEQTTNPLAVPTLQPAFSWMGQHPDRGEFQTAWRIGVASSPAKLAQEDFDLWDSGKVGSSQSLQNIYGGASLRSAADYYWQAMIWDSQDRGSGWSEPAFFGVGLLEESDWQARWLSFPSRSAKPILLRGLLDLSGQIVQARAYVCGLGYYEFFVNGRRIGDHVLDPGWTEYTKRVLYATYDVTDQLTIGRNALGLMVGKGRFGSYITNRPGFQPQALLQLKVTLDDGRIVWFSTAERERWLITDEGPITDSTVYDGETYDARQEIPGWNEPDFQPDERWHKPIITEGPGGRLVSQIMEPVKVVEEIQPISLQNPQTGIYVFDLGQNIAGGIRIRLRGPAGTAIAMKFAEVCYDNGLIATENLKTVKATDTYILKGDPEEIYEQHFTYHGFRFVQIEGCVIPPQLGDLTGRLIRSAVHQSGRFNCSNDLINRIHRCITWTEADNLMSIPTDCPQRDERLGWLNDLTVRAEESIYNFHLAKFYAKFTDDIADTQGSLGAIADTAPFCHFGRRPACPVSSSYLLLPWLLYLHYGDSRTMAEHYTGLKRWNDYLAMNAQDDIVEFSSYGDWASPLGESVAGSIGSGAISAKTPGIFMSTGYYYFNCLLLAKMAAVLGQVDEEARQLAAAARIKDAINRRFYHPETATYAEGSQGANVFALYLDLVPKAARADVLANLLADIRKRDYHLSTGNQCTKYLIEVLTAEGLADIALKIVTQTTYPSWGYMLSLGATTIWERWEHIISGPLCGMASHNHPMHAAVGAWFYKMLAGISASEEGPGFARVHIQPYMPADLTFAAASLDTVRGTFYSGWHRDGLKKTVEVVIPFNASADVLLVDQSTELTQVHENGQLIWDGVNLLAGAAGIQRISLQEGQLVAIIGSGHYQFIVTRKPI